MGLLQGQQAAEFDAMSGTKRLSDSVDECGCDHTFSCLLPDLKDIDPDDAFSSVPYEKGFNLLVHLSTKVGAVLAQFWRNSAQFCAIILTNLLVHLSTKVGAAGWADFVKAYIGRFKFTTLTSADFRSFFDEWSAAHGHADALRHRLAVSLHHRHVGRRVVHSRTPRRRAHQRGSASAAQRDARARRRHAEYAARRAVEEGRASVRAGDGR